MKKTKTSSKAFIGILIILIALNAAVMVASIAFGSVKLSPKDVITGLFGANSSEGVNAIVSSIRLPRMLGAAVAGIAFAVSGLLLQTVTNNPLCSPNIIGINSGAGFSVILVLSVFPSLSSLTPIAAFVGAVAVSFSVLAISVRFGKGRSEILVLTGVAVGSLFSAGISFLSVMYPDVLASYTSFSVGGFSGIYSEDIALPSLIIAVFLALSAIVSPKLNALCLGDSVASSLGVNIKAVKAVSVISAAAMSAAAVSFAGLVGFVGLIVPSIARALVGADTRKLLPVSALLGSCIVIASDLLGRVIFAPTEIPSGIIMSCLGVPFFLFLLLKRRRRI